MTSLEFRAHCCYYLLRFAELLGQSEKIGDAKKAMWWQLTRWPAHRRLSKELATAPCTSPPA